MANRTRVESIDLKVAFEDVRDIETILDWCHELARVLEAPLCARDGSPLDPAGLRALVQASVRTERRARALLGLVGLLAMAAGGLCLYGFDFRVDPSGFDERGVVRHVRLTKPGMALCVGGVVLLTVAAAGARASMRLGASQRSPHRS